MEENFSLNYALITAGITLLGGIILFLLQKLIERVLLLPIQRQKEIIEEIAVALIEYAKFYTNPVNPNYSVDNIFKKQRIDASEKTRKLAALLKVRSDNVLLYNFWDKVKYIAPRNSINRAYAELIGLSNGYFDQNLGDVNYERANKVRILLGIPIDN